MSKHAMTILGIILSVVPLAVALVAYFHLFPETIPNHFDFAGNVTAWSSSSSAFLLGGILTGANLLCVLCMAFAEPLMAAGLVHGVRTAATARWVLLGTVVVVDLVDLFITGMQYRTCVQMGLV